MDRLSNRASALGQIFSSVLILAVLLLGVWAMWAGWYISRLPIVDASQIGIAVRLAPAITTLLVVCFCMVGLWLAAGRVLFLRVVVRYRWRFACALGGVLGIRLIAFRALAMRPYHWGEQDAQILLMGGAVCGLLVVIALTGGNGYWIARKLDKTAAP